MKVKGFLREAMMAIVVFAAIATACTQTDEYADYKTIELSLKSKYFDFERKVVIGLPPEYDAMTAQDYDVMYVFDAQDRSYFDLVRGMPVFVNMPYECKFIVVGIYSPVNENYSRQDDFLKIKYPNGHGGFHSALSKFIHDELMPYISENYRVSDRSIAVGHSLGGSFALDALLDYELFTDYITVSPNMHLVNGELSNELVGFDYNTLKTKHFVFASDANEELIPNWSGWKPSREKVYEFFEAQNPENVMFNHKSYPDYNHMTTFPIALYDGMAQYFSYRDSIDQIPTEKEHKVKITLVSNRAVDDVYVAGNQDALNNWDAEGVKMQRVSDTEFSIELTLKLPAQFKFTRGDWEKEAFIKNYSFFGGNLLIDTDRRTSYTYEVSSWSDDAR